MGQLLYLALFDCFLFARPIGCFLYFYCLFTSLPLGCHCFSVLPLLSHVPPAVYIRVPACVCSYPSPPPHPPSLSLSLKKTKCMVIATRQKHKRSPLRLKLDIDSKTVVQVKEHRVLGITIDDEFKWQSHVSNICKTVSKNIFLMSQLKRYVSSQTLKIFYSSHILPHISFSSTVWDGCGETHLIKLNSLHRRAAKLLLPDKNSSTDEKMKALSILPLQK